MDKIEQKKILVVGDNPSNPNSGKMALKNLELDVITVSSIRKALETLLEHNDISLIVLDAQILEGYNFEPSNFLQMREELQDILVLFTIGAMKFNEFIHQGGHSEDNEDASILSNKYLPTTGVTDFLSWQNQKKQLSQEISAYKQSEELLQKTYSELERRVEERASELAETNVTLLEVVVERLRLEERLTAIYQLGRELTLLREQSTIIRRVLETATNVLWFEIASLGLVDKSNNELVYRHQIGDVPFPHKERISLDEKKGIGVAVVQTGQAINIPDTAQDERYVPLPQGARSRSALCVPLRIGEQISGVLNVESAEVNYFTSAEQQLLQTLADHAAVALENARLYDKLSQRVEELILLNDVGQMLVSNLDLQESLNIVIDYATRLLNVEATALVLRNEIKGHLQLVGVSGNPAVLEDKEVVLGQGIVGWVIQHGYSALVPDASADPRFSNEVDSISGFNTKSVLCVPLWTKRQTIGAIEVINKKTGGFQGDDLRLLNLLAIPASIAIENARLFNIEQHARQTTEILHLAGLNLTYTLNLDVIFETLLNYLAQLIPYDRANVMLLEENGQITIRASHNTEEWPDSDVDSPSVFDIQTYSLIQKLARNKKSILISDMSATPDEQYPPGAKNMQTWLGVPLVAGGKFIGLYSAYKAYKYSFTKQHQHLAEALAVQAAAAVQNAQLFAQVQMGRKRLQKLSRRLVEVQEAERHHIARELHDEASQSLTSLLVDLRLLEEKEDCSDSILARVDKLKAKVNTILENLHQLALNLRPASLDHLGLVAALRQHINTFNRQHNPPVQFETFGFTNKRLSPDAETALYRIVQEALTNVVRHAQAKHIDVILKWRDDKVTVIIEDDGVGFEPEEAMQRSRLGLLGIRERVEMLDGKLTIESSSGIGTTIFVEIIYEDSDTNSR